MISEFWVVNDRDRALRPCELQKVFLCESIQAIKHLLVTIFAVCMTRQVVGEPQQAEP